MLDGRSEGCKILSRRMHATGFQSCFSSLPCFLTHSPAYSGSTTVRWARTFGVLRGLDGMSVNR